MKTGPLMIGIEGLELTAADKTRLIHPLVGGVILFKRNFESPAQLISLISSIHELRSPRLVVAVDHEGGRVQRFKSGFTHLPPMSLCGRHYQISKTSAKKLAQSCGELLATELLSCGVDFSFAPVLDVNTGKSEVIGDRAFHQDPKIISELAGHFYHGVKEMGMAAVGKHFPGHGHVVEDTHFEFSQDTRSQAQIFSEDLAPYEQLVKMGLEGVMTAHIAYPEVDDEIVTYSSKWLKDILRTKMKYQGLVFSDDMGMAAAKTKKAPSVAVKQALDAGCDMILLCNDFEMIDEVLEHLDYVIPDTLAQRVQPFYGRLNFQYDALSKNEDWHKLKKIVETA